MEIKVKKNQLEAVRFLKQYQMDPLDVSIEENIEAFLSQMHRGLAGQKSTLEMIPTYLTAENDVPSHKKVIVADAGGTNFRVATIYFDEAKNAVIENLQLFRMPGVERELNSNDFFRAMAEYFRSVADTAAEIGFCFSYPAEVLSSKDGRLIRFAKEIKAKASRASSSVKTSIAPWSGWVFLPTNISLSSTTRSRPCWPVSDTKTASSTASSASSSAPEPIAATSNTTPTSRKKRTSTPPAARSSTPNPAEWVQAIAANSTHASTKPPPTPAPTNSKR
jgi:hypothetical protein